MGVITKIHCNNCGHDFTREYGVGKNDLLENLGADVIIGIDFFRRYRLVFLGGKIEFPPQGI